MKMLLLAFVIYSTLKEVYGSNRMRYLSTEHPEILWFNPKYFRHVNMTAQRRSRADPLYYMGYHVDIIWPINNNVNIDFYLYEYVTNQYRRSFIDMHFELCELLVKDLFFGVSFGLFFPYSCPLKPGVYHVENVTLPVYKIPKVVPFSKGRVKANFTSKDTHELLGTGQLDVEIKEVSIRRMKDKSTRK